MKCGSKKYARGGDVRMMDDDMPMMKKGGKVKKYAKGGKVRGCGMAKRGVRKAKMR